MAEAVAERLKGRVGNPKLKANSGNISLIDQGRTRDLAAAKAGLGSGNAAAWLPHRQGVNTAEGIKRRVSIVPTPLRKFRRAGQRRLCRPFARQVACYRVTQFPEFREFGRWPGIATVNTLPTPAKNSADVRDVFPGHTDCVSAGLLARLHLLCCRCGHGLAKRYPTHHRHPCKSFVELAPMAEAVAERLKGRHGGDRKNQGGNISALKEQGETRDLAAAKAGLGSGKTLEAAQKVLAHGKVVNTADTLLRCAKVS